MAIQCIAAHTCATKYVWFPSKTNLYIPEEKQQEQLSWRHQSYLVTYGCVLYSFALLYWQIQMGPQLLDVHCLYSTSVSNMSNRLSSYPLCQLASVHDDGYIFRYTQVYPPPREYRLLLHDNKVQNSLKGLWSQCWGDDEPAPTASNKEENIMWLPADSVG